VAGGTLCHLRRNSHRLCCCFVSEQQRYNRSGSAAEAAASREERNIQKLLSKYHFFPLDLETFGPIN